LKNNIIIIVIDALRARNLECYGYNKPTSPNLNNLAENGVLFENAFSTTNATDPSLISMFTGKYPMSSGIRNHGERMTETEKRMAMNLVTLPKILNRYGYVTLGVNWLGRWHKSGYHFYGIDYPWHYRLIKLISSFYHLKLLEIKYTTETAINLLRKYYNKKFFLYIHFWGTHTPYSAPESYVNLFYRYHKGAEIDINIENIFKIPFNSKWRTYLYNWLKELPNIAYVLSQYDAAIAFIDSQIGKIYQTLCDLGILDDTNIIVTADHGESLIEHGIYFDHHGLYDESIHVPLIFSGPLFPKKKRVSSLVQHVDIVPTLLDLLKIPFKKSFFDGFSLLPILEDNISEIRHFIISEETYTENKIAIRTKKWKYIFSPSKKSAICKYCNIIHGGIEELYNLDYDPEERYNLIEVYPLKAKELKEILSAWLEKMKEKRGKLKLIEKIRRIKRQQFFG